MVSDEERHMVKVSMGIHDTPVTPIGRFLRNHPDKHSTPIFTIMISLATTGHCDDQQAARHSPLRQVPNQPTNHPPPAPPTNAPLNLRMMSGPLHPYPPTVQFQPTNSTDVYLVDWKNKLNIFFLCYSCK